MAKGKKVSEKRFLVVKLRDYILQIYKKWLSNLAPRIKTKFKISVGKFKKLKIHRGQLIFHRGAKQNLCLKNRDIP